MVSQIALTLICVILMIYLSRHLFLLNSRLRTEAEASRMRKAVDWRDPPALRKRPRSRISQIFDF